MRDEEDFLYLCGLQELDRELLLSQRSDEETNGKILRQMLRKRKSKVSYFVFKYNALPRISLCVNE